MCNKDTNFFAPDILLKYREYYFILAFVVKMYMPCGQKHYQFFSFF